MKEIIEKTIRAHCAGLRAIGGELADVADVIEAGNLDNIEKLGELHRINRGMQMLRDAISRSAIDDARDVRHKIFLAFDEMALNTSNYYGCDEARRLYLLNGSPLARTIESMRRR